MSVRTRRVGGEIRKALGEILTRDYSDVSNGLVTVTDVEMSPDLRNCKVYVSVLGGSVPAEKVIALLNDRASGIRTAMGKKVYLRVSPQVVFYVDVTGERVERISRLINEWHEEQPPKDAPEE